VRGRSEPTYGRVSPRLADRPSGDALRSNEFCNERTMGAGDRGAHEGPASPGVLMFLVTIRSTTSEQKDFLTQ